jgi:truncated hemoglobin YjbI
MAKAHEGRGISEGDFNRVAFHVVSTLHELSVPEILIQEVVAVLLPLKAEIAE